jgi:hypothetical protein
MSFGRAGNIPSRTQTRLATNRLNNISPSECNVKLAPMAFFAFRMASAKPLLRFGKP